VSAAVEWRRHCSSPSYYHYLQHKKDANGRRQIKRENYLKSQLEISVEKETGCRVREYSIFTKIASFFLSFFFKFKHQHKQFTRAFLLGFLSLTLFSFRQAWNQSNALDSNSILCPGRRAQEGGGRLDDSSSARIP
jgi:hypothetical protein